MNNKDVAILKIFKWFVPGLMIVVLCFQLYFVSFHNLSRWKGAGMGMFSTYKKRIVKLSTPEYLKGALFSTTVSDSSELSLEEFPNVKNADRLWNFVSSTHFFGKENQIHSIPSLHLGELPTSMRIARTLNEVSLLNQMNDELRQIQTATVRVFGVKSYEPGVGMIHFETLLKRDYGLTGQDNK